MKAQFPQQRIVPQHAQAVFRFRFPARNGIKYIGLKNANAQKLCWWTKLHEYQFSSDFLL